MTSPPFESYLDTIRALTDEVLIPSEERMVQLGHVPDEVMTAIAEAGLFGISIPRAYRGLEFTMEEQVRLTFEFTRASLVYRSRFSPNIGLCTQALLNGGSHEQQDRWLPAMASGSCIVSFALTEPLAGSDAAVQSVAEDQGTHLELSGDKRFITNAGWADMFVAFARTTTPGGEDRGVSAYLVDARAPGVNVSLPARMNGHEDGPVGEIHFERVRLDHSSLLGEVGKGLSLALKGINHARTHVAAASVGQATRLVNEMTRHSMQRRQFGVPIAEFGAIESLIGESVAELAAARALALSCARAQDQGKPSRADISAAKLFGSEMVGRVADRAVQILGGDGIVGDSPVPRMWRDVRALRIYEGTSEIHRRNLARLTSRMLTSP